MYLCQPPLKTAIHIQVFAWAQKKKKEVRTEEFWCMWIRVSFVCVHFSVRFSGLKKGTNGYTWQTYVGLWGSAEVDGITVQANVL